MRTIKELSKLAGVSVRTLQYYDKIGLLKPTNYSNAGYRLYSDKDMEKLQQILLFRELEFSLKEIKTIINNKNFDKAIALDQQIKLLTLKKERLENLILFAKAIKLMGVDVMNFSAFDTEDMQAYAQQAKEAWGNTKAFKDFETKQKNKSNEEINIVSQQIMMIFAEFGKIKSEKYDSAAAQFLVEKLQNFITANFYECSKQILSGLGQMYASGGAFTKNIDEFAGEGTAQYVHNAITYYCS